MQDNKKETEETLQKQQRKERAANGKCTSKMMSFRIDADNVAFLEDVPNKGRLINNLLDKCRLEWEKKTGNGA